MFVFIIIYLHVITCLKVKHTMSALVYKKKLKRDTARSE